MRDQILRHQLLLMRLVRTQAKATRKHIKKAEAEIIKAIESGNYVGLRNKIIMAFGPMEGESLKLINELAVYEANFTAKTLRKYVDKDATKPSDSRIINEVNRRPVSVSLNRQPQNIASTVAYFATTKIAQYEQALRDSEALQEDKATRIKRIKNLTDGLFTVQNLSLAGVFVIAAANIAREIVAFHNGWEVQWSAILDETTCPYCESQDGQVFSALEITDEIPAHARCRCTWIPV